MWLFDDILKKPAPTNNADPLGNMGASGMGGQGNSGGNPGDDGISPVVSPAFTIQKSAPESIFAPIATPVTPAPTSSGEDSLIIVSSTEDMPTTAPAMEAPAPTIATPEVVSSIFTPATPVVPIMEVAASEPMQEVTSTDSLFGSFTPETPVAPVMAPEVVPSDTPIASLFEMVAPTPVAVAPVPDEVVEMQKPEPVYVAPVASVAVTEMKAEQTPTVSENSFFHPTDFIEKSIADIDVMIANIDAKHASKIDEAQEYGAEKVRFTGLEKGAYAEAATMDAERDHAMHMKELLQSELPHNKAKAKKHTSHVESTLTGIAVHNTVEKTMEHKTHPRAKVAA